MTRQSAWALKIAALIKAGNPQAAVAQIRVAPTVKDVQQLRTLLTSTQVLRQYPTIDAATSEQIVALSSPRLHRSP